MRAKAGLLGMIVFVACASGVAVAQDQSPTPTCSAPNQPARTLAAAIPVLPAYAQQIHAFGTVTVRVDLDADSKIVATRVVQSASPVLNVAALEAVRASTFATTIRNCTPVPGTFNFLVTFSDPGAPSLTPPPTMSAYFSGAWSCATKLGSLTLRLFGMNFQKTSLVAANAFTDANGVVYQNSETYTQQGDTISALQRVGFMFSGTSKGWVGDTLSFRGVETSGSTATAQTMTYKRVDAGHFIRTFATVPSDGPPIVTSTEQCTRVPIAVFHP